MPIIPRTIKKVSQQLRSIEMSVSDVRDNIGHPDRLAAIDWGDVALDLEFAQEKLGGLIKWAYEAEARTQKE